MIARADRPLRSVFSGTTDLAWSRRIRSVVTVVSVLLIFFAGTLNAQTAKQTTKVLESAKRTGRDGPLLVKPVIEPKALEIIKASCDRLAAARSMGFTAVVTYESPSLLGPPIAYTTRSEVTVQRPDKLRIITPGDGPPSEFYYNGKTMAAFSPKENLIAVADAPSTIDAALKVAFDSAAIYFPFTDVIVADPYKGIETGLMLAFYIGQSQVVGGTTTDMVAYANKDLFVQAWIGAKDRLPRMIRAVYRADPVRLRHQLEISNWQVDMAVPPDAFTSSGAASAKAIAFAHPEPKPAAGARPVEGKPTKSR